MSRPTKCRRVCRRPLYDCFIPKGEENAEKVRLSVDEYETIRIIDYEGNTQEQCAKRMNVSRTTVTDIYNSARHKIAKLLIEGMELEICGGNFTICDGSANRFCGNSQCVRAKRRAQGSDIENSLGGNTMKIAVTYDNGDIFQHFGHSQYFKVYEIEGGKITSAEVVGTDGQGHGALAGLLFNGGVEVLICGGIGGGAQAALAEAGIKVYGGCAGSADEAVQAYLDGTLDYNPDVRCEHHEHNHEEGHTCGSHGCGNHGCH